MEHLGVSGCKEHEIDIAGKSAIVNLKQYFIHETSKR